MGEITEGNLLGDFKHDQPAIYMDGETPRILREFLHKQEELMVKYRISKVDLCFKPNFDEMALEASGFRDEFSAASGA